MKKILFLFLTCISLYSCGKDTIITEDKEFDVIYDKSDATQAVIQIFRYDGSEEHNLTQDLNYNFWWPRVSFDEKKFLCYRSLKKGPTQSENPTNDYENAELMTFNIDGSDPKVIISKGQYGWKAQGVAKFSPDGNHILMAALCSDSLRGYTNLQWRLVVTDINGNNPKIISPQNKVYADPAWSPDGKKIVYVSLPNDKLSGWNDDFEIFVSDYAEDQKIITNEVRLTNDSLYCFDPCWSYDGRYIAFTSCHFFSTPFDSDIIRVKPDGSEQTTLLNDNLSNGVPYWTPDSKRLYFHTLGIGTTFSIASCDGINGGDKKILRLGGVNGALYSSPQPIKKL